MEVQMMEHCSANNNASQDNRDHDKSLDPGDDHDKATPMKLSGSQWFQIAEHPDPLN